MVVEKNEKALLLFLVSVPYRTFLSGVRRYLSTLSSILLTFGQFIHFLTFIF